MDYLNTLPFSSLGDALEYQSKIRPNKTAILYPDRNKDSKEYASLTYKQYNQIVDYLAENIWKYLKSDESNLSITCALLGVGGIEYLLCQYALLKLPNVIMFPISTRNSQPAIEHLLRETKTQLLITSSQYLSIIDSIKAKEEFKTLEILYLENELFNINNLLRNEDIQCSLTYKNNLIKGNRDEQINKIVVILHSSGSTSYPKTIYLTNRYFLMSSSLYLSINQNYWHENDVVLYWGALFHLLAFNGTVRSIVLGCTYALPLSVTFPPTPDELRRNITIENRLTALITVPSLLEQLIRQLITNESNQIHFEPLRKLRFIMYGGAGCPDQLCRNLVDNGIVLLSVYGATETGIVLLKNCQSYDKRWKFMEIPNIRKEFIRIETPLNAENSNEKILFHLPNDPFLAENISNCSDGCYTVGDVLLEDPPNSGQYLILGRQDDTLVHVNGEKTNPVPMEDFIRRSPFVKQVVVVGHNQFCTAALIQLNYEKIVNVDFNQIEDLIWGIVEQANEEAPTHSRLLRKLVRILDKDQCLPVTDKGNLMRQRINKDYSTLISSIFDEFFNDQQASFNKISNIETIQSYLENKIRKMSHVDEKIKFSQSIFELGFNSLQIIELRNDICQDICSMDKNFLYEYSTIEEMSQQLFKSLNSNSNDRKDFEKNHHLLTEQILDKYIQLIRSDQIASKKNIDNEQRTILLTGANGSLGSFVLQDLLRQPVSIIKRIYCLIRGSNPKQRLVDSFKEKQLDVDLLNESIDKRLFVYCATTDLNLFNVDFECPITDLVHSAWKMNFNQTIKHFEFDTILPLVNLLKFSALNSIRFHFISSISSAASGFLAIVEEKSLPRITEIALPQGYGQSKYVAEHICWTANQFWNIPMNIYRIGQISGDTIHGFWNRNDMAAMMIYAAAGKIKKMPNLEQNINWIPLDICSSSFVHLMLNSSILRDTNVYHLINPKSIKYEDYVSILKKSNLDFQIVSIDEFLDTISNIKDLTNPLVKLLSFFEQIYKNKNSSEFSTFETKETIKQCPLLEHCPEITPELIRLYLNYWNDSQMSN